MKAGKPIAKKVDGLVESPFNDDSVQVQTRSDQSPELELLRGCGVLPDWPVGPVT